jgi:hypothetical protein
LVRGSDVCTLQLPAGGAQDRMYHARSRLASRRMRCTRGTPTLPGDPVAGPDATWRVVGGGLRNRPYNRCAGRAAMFAGASHAAACRGDAVRRPGASVHHGPMANQRGDRTCDAPNGRPTGSPLHCPPVGRRIVCTTPVPVWRHGGCVARGGRPCCQAIPPRDPMQHGMLQGRFANRPWYS